MSEVVLKTEGLTKHYGGVHALEDANFELRQGEHVAIMGDNGAGKSTFVRQITGVEQRTRGKVTFFGEEVNFAGPLDAREVGIETVFQTLALADDLDVPDNLFLGREKTPHHGAACCHERTRYSREHQDIDSLRRGLRPRGCRAARSCPAR